MKSILRKIPFLKQFKNFSVEIFSPLYYRISCKFTETNKLKALARTYAHGYFKGRVFPIEEARLRLILNEIQNRGEIDDSIKWCQEMLNMGLSDSNSLKLAQPESAFLAQPAQTFDFFDLLKNRRSVRTWIKKPVEREVLNRIIQAAIEAPCSCNRQSWKFLILQDKQKIERVSTFRGEKFLSNAAALILVFCDISLYPAIEKSYSPYMDAAVAAENMLLAVQYLGLGACIVNMGRNTLTQENRANLYKEFNIPKQFESICVIAIGYPDKINKKPARNQYESYIINHD